MTRASAVTVALAMALLGGCGGMGGGGGAGVGGSPDARPGGQPAVGPAPAPGPLRPAGVGEGVGAGVSTNTWQAALAEWPAEARTAAERIGQKYGPPSEATDSALTWRDAGPWQLIMVGRALEESRIPGCPTGVLSQSVAYKDPGGNAADLAALDGSVTLQLSSGTIAAHCDTEDANVLALNLAHDILTGKRSAEEAKGVFTEQLRALRAGRPAPLSERLVF